MRSNAFSIVWCYTWTSFERKKITNIFLIIRDSAISTCLTRWKTINHEPQHTNSIYYFFASCLMAVVWWLFRCYDNGHSQSRFMWSKIDWLLFFVFFSDQYSRGCAKIGKIDRKNRLVNINIPCNRTSEVQMRLRNVEIFSNIWKADDNWLWIFSNKRQRT